MSSSKIKILAFLPLKRRKAGCQASEASEKAGAADTDFKQKTQKVKAFSELDAKQKSSRGNSGLMHSLTKGDKKAIENGNLLQGCLDNGIKSFTPNLMMEKFVQDYKLAKHIYSDSFLQHFTGYDPNYIEKNIKIPEFQRELA